MKSVKNFRSDTLDISEDTLLRKSNKLSPVKKNVKEKRSSLDYLDDDGDEELLMLKKRESVLDYYDED